MRLPVIICAALAALCLTPCKAVEIAESAVSVEESPTWVIPTSHYIKSIGVHSALTQHLKYSFRFAQGTRERYFYPTAYQGIGLANTVFLENSKLGYPLSLYVFQGARLAKLGSRLSLDYEWNFGVSALWKAYDNEKNPENGAVGSPVNAALTLGLRLRYRLDNRWALTAGIDGSHYSDGNSKLPNGGVNTASVRVGVSYSFDARQSEKTAGQYSFEPGMEYDILLFGAPVQRMYTDDAGDLNLLDRTFFVGGVSVTPMYAFHPMFCAGVSADFTYDDSASLDKNRVPGLSGDDVKFYRQPFKERFSVGLALHAQLNMPIFSINVGLGRNVIAKGHDMAAFYQSLALKAYIYKGSFINIGYQLHNFHEPNHLMLGIGYTFGKR